ncbi:hypothetical protein [Massilia agri]|uniref:Phytase-like domain-containing protein n=1 Tax=Massilia agri TaxID=1886785 RepID=A0ABT2APF0_9BURK|nr:hypothetical protein [Massilia agri]MCS0598108.1 hypothetical protein [Massilia agri]
MYIYSHRSADELLDLDDNTGIAVQVTESDGEKIWAGSTPLALRARHKVRGSYTIEAGRRCACFWNDERELVFLTPDGERFVLFQIGADGRVQARMPGTGVDLAPAIDSDGKQIAGFSRSILADGSGRSFFEIVYESMSYLTLFGLNSMLAFVPTRSCPTGISSSRSSARSTNSAPSRAPPSPCQRRILSLRRWPRGGHR